MSIKAQPQDVLALARSGKIGEAVAAAEALLAAGLRDGAFSTFVGVLCCRNGDLSRGIVHFRQAVEITPAEPLPRIELARALLSTGDNAGAEQVSRSFVGAATSVGRELQRIHARAVLLSGQPELALPLFEELVAIDAGDFESWDGIGLAKLALADTAGAIAALGRATQIRPIALTSWVNLARAYHAVRDYPNALAASERATSLSPDDRGGLIEKARAFAGLSRKDEALACIDVMQPDDDPDLALQIADIEFTVRAFAAAEGRYRSILGVAPEMTRAWVGLGKLLERTNRIPDLFDLIAAAKLAGVPDEAMMLLHARALRADGQMEDALAMAQAANENEDATARYQLIGDIADRLGQADLAFEMFTKANDLLLETTASSRVNAEQFRDKFRELEGLVTPQWYARWPARAPFEGRSPLFIFGFPRSGTTLIDTMLSGHPEAVVLEEEPIIDNVAKALGPVERLLSFTPAELTDFRQLYFDEVSKIAGDVTGKLVVDKNPLGLSSTPLLFFLFPEAKFLFMERHPFDVVLSCFIMSSRLNANVASFFEFEGTARLYDYVLSYWTKCCETLPFERITVRYEQLIERPEEELRRVAEFAQLGWHDNLLAHEDNAANRDYIGSPSYAQVAEPLYTRARGRWLRYRRYMEIVRPILNPWIERLRYDPGLGRD